MNELPPEAMAAIMGSAQDMGTVGEYFFHCFGQFQFDGILHTPPTRSFDGELDLQVGDKPVHLIEVGPGPHPRRCLGALPADRVVFTGDISIYRKHADYVAGAGRQLDESLSAY